MSIKWSNDLETGNETVDGQHRQIFVFLNELIDACENGAELEKLRDTLDFLVNYTVRHFGDEEALQRAVAYPDYERHKKMHDAFKETVGDLVGRFEESGSSSALSADVNQIIVNWLMRHIRGEDKRIGSHIRATDARC